MGFQSTQSTYKPKILAPLYGTSTQEVADEAMVLGLANHFADPLSLAHNFTLSAPNGSGLYLYFAYPVSLGLAEFYDNDSQFTGGWDGANNDPYSVYGPIILNITVASGAIVPFYVYRSDYSDLGTTTWTSSAAV